MFTRLSFHLLNLKREAITRCLALIRPESSSGCPPSQSSPAAHIWPYLPQPRSVGLAVAPELTASVTGREVGEWI